MREYREYSLTLVIAVVVATLVFVRWASRDAAGVDLENFAAAQLPGLGADAAADTTPPAWYDFRDAVYRHDYARAQQMLDANPGLLAMRNGIGETPLHFLAVENDRDGVAWLHARGADLNTRNEFGEPVLFEVAQLEYKELFLWLVRNGADIRATDAEGHDIVWSLLEFGKPDMADWVRSNLR